MNPTGGYTKPAPPIRHRSPWGYRERIVNENPASKVVAGAIILPGECGEDDITSANLEQMAASLAMRPPTDADRRELVEILRWLAKVVRNMEGPSSHAPTPLARIDDPSTE